MAEAKPRPRLLYVVTEDWFFASHFLPMARAAMALGYEVAVATRVRDHEAAIAAEGVRVLPVASDRGGLRPAALANDIARLASLMYQEQPDLVHCIALRSIVVGGLAAEWAGITKAIFAVTGLGHVWVSRTMGARIARWMIRRVVKRLRRPGSRFLFENHDDPAALGLPAEGSDVAFVPGAGVDPQLFVPAPEPDEPPLRTALVSRMLRAKGVDTAVSAVKQLRADGVDVTLDLYGLPDPDNPATVGEDELRAWGALDGISWHGRSADVPAIWRGAHVALAPSRYREGIPRAIVEAMASGRPLVTTDVPGCRELIRDGVDGLIVPKDDPTALAAAIRRLVGDPDARRRMGEAARQRFEEGFSESVVVERISALYRSFLG